MAERILGVLLTPPLALLAVLAVPGPARAATGCVTRGEYARVDKGMPYTQVEQVFGAHHVDATSGGAGAVVWTYRACDSRYVVKVTYAVPAQGSGRLYTERWVAA